MHNSYAVVHESATRIQLSRDSSAHMRVLGCTAAVLSSWWKQTRRRAEVSEVKLKSGCPHRAGAAKVITVKLKGTAVETRLSPSHSSKWSHGAHFAYQIVKYCPWHRRNRGVINALNQSRIAPRRVAPPGRCHYRELWRQMRGMKLLRASVVPLTPVISYYQVRMFFFFLRALV